MNIMINIIVPDGYIVYTIIMISQKEHYKC